ncbi:Uncharacterised protein [Vibrio cholerae]|nr:Uncharacterised protein [Vibrio cholerae]
MFLCRGRNLNILIINLINLAVDLCERLVRFSGKLNHHITLRATFFHCFYCAS